LNIKQNVVFKKLCRNLHKYFFIFAITFHYRMRRFIFFVNSAFVGLLEGLAIYLGPREMKLNTP